ncbi:MULTISPECIES: DMT family transporter [unclassified Bacillus (in: firmicutes)]|uniref:DMT family transporter n=1 Tax=unclassified Bacillus (in: firmicutes) TaxID=185979 RepID=UPI0008EF0B34|nr:MULTISPECIES: DMT family transporter [unclassified Bacillus (in: firmicutes)]SFB09655.1 transporter family-2 protein [Bacillus sp. UNCCL13]SFQ86619.1 transporter family-2 protein [Bacillus sp. cl95]
MEGMLFAILAGVFISLQTVFNAKVSGKVGAWATTVLVLGLGFIASLPMFIAMDDRSLFDIGGINKLYLLSGAIGVGIVFCITQAIRLLGPAYAISLVLVSQLTMAVIIDTFGWFGFATNPLTMNNVIGLGLMMMGIVVIKMKARSWKRTQKQGSLCE